MDAAQIQDLRAMLAAQTLPEPRPNFAHKLRGLLKPRSATPIAQPPSIPAESPAVAASLASATDDAPLLLVDDGPDMAGDPIPPQMLLGDIAPRRPAFGQRSEPVLELSEPVAPEPRRLTLMAADGAAVGEIILHANESEARRPFEPLHSEVPFFPDDLADEPAPRRKTAPVTPRAATPSPELAATFLLATLAARLASEEQALRQRLAAANVLSLAA